MILPLELFVALHLLVSVSKLVHLLVESVQLPEVAGCLSFQLLTGLLVEEVDCEVVFAACGLCSAL